MFGRIARLLPAIAWMAFIFTMSSQRKFSQTFGVSVFLMSVAAHMVLYGVLALLLLLAIAGNERPARATLVAAIVGAAVYGVTDEFHQSFVPGRDASVFDLAVNAIGALVAVTFWTQFRTFFMEAKTR